MRLDLRKQRLSSAPGRTLLVGLSLILTAGCDKALTIPDRFPEPVVQALPLDVGLHYTEEFAHYRYSEDVEGDAQWVIDLGKANVGLFDAVSRRLFRSAARASELPTVEKPATFDAVIEPNVEAFEFSLPSQSATDQYSVWIRYNLKIYGPAGDLITTWTVSAYGESGSEMLRPSRSMEQATILAMRDAAATISLGFATEAKIREALLKESSDAKE